MAEYRVINTSIWKDEYVSGLTTEELVLFLYLHTNQSIEYYGVMESNVDRMSSESGLSVDAVDKTLKKFEKDEKL